MRLFLQAGSRLGRYTPTRPCVYGVYEAYRKRMTSEIILKLGESVNGVLIVDEFIAFTFQLFSAHPSYGLNIKVDRDL